MNDDIQNTIEVLSKRIASKEEETNRLKKIVNELCVEAGIPQRYDIVEVGAAAGPVRSDEYYGQTLTAAIRKFLERRKSAGLGAASVADIYKAVRDGGYKFEAKSEDIAKISVNNTLRKSSSIFHRVPSSGDYGLLIWYPSAKAEPEPEAPKTKRKGKSAKKGHSPTPAKSEEAGATEPEKTNDEPPEKTNVNAVTQSEITNIVLAQNGNFKASDIANALKQAFPGREIIEKRIANVIFELKKEKGLIREVSPRFGTKGAVYAKA